MATQSNDTSNGGEDAKDWSIPAQEISRESPPASRQPRSPETTPKDESQDKNKSKGKEGNATWRSLFVFTNRDNAPHIACALAASIIGGLTKPTGAILFGRVFLAMTRFGGGTLDAKETLHDVAKWCLILTGLAAAAWLIEGIFLFLWVVFGELQTTNARQKIFSCMLDKDIEWYDLREEGIGSLLTRIETQVRELQLAVSQPLGFLVYETSATLGGIGTALYFSWKLTLVILVSFPVAAGILAFISKGVGPAIERQKRELSKASKYASMSVTAIDTVKAFNGQDQEIWQYFSTIKKVAKYYLVQARINALQFGVLKLLMVGVFVQGFWYGLYLVTKGLNVGHVLTTFYSCLGAMQSVEIVLPQFLVLAKGISAGETLKSILVEMQDGRSTRQELEGWRPNSCPGDIEVNDVTFGYPSNPRQNVLDNTTFFFPAGETTFVVGKSGSGKSTLGNLLLKYYEAHSGEILIDGQLIEDLDTDWLRQNVTLAQQQSVLFNETILQNIAFGTQEYVSRQDIYAAAKTAYLQHTIDEMPNGFDTVVGPKHRPLSGGQTQRVAIARARLRDAPILILDESTSALDYTSRIEVMKRIREWRRGKTTIIITHDISQIHEEDYVYVLEDAKVVQEGYCKTLAENSHGVFASFLSNVEAPSDSSLPLQEYEPNPLAIYDNLEPVHEDTSHWGSISNIFSMPDPPSLSVPGSRLSLGVAVAQANALRADNIWSTPVIPESPISNPGKQYSPFMSFMSPRPPPQVPLPTLESPMRENPVENSPTSRRSLYKIYASSQPHLPNINTPTIIPGVHSATKSTERKTKVVEVQNALDRKAAPLTKVFGSIWPTLDWKERTLLILGFISSFIVAAATPAFAWVYSQLLKTFYNPENRTVLARNWALCMIGVAIIDGTASYFTHYFLECAGQAWINALRVESLKRILAQPRSWFDKEENSPNRLTECLDRDAEEMRNLLGRFAGLVFTVIWMISISLVWAFIVDWKFTLVILSSGPALYIITRLSHYTSGKWEGRSNQAAEDVDSIFFETFSNIRVVRALTLENYFNRKHDTAIRHANQVGKSRAAFAGLFFGLAEAMSYSIVALAFYYGTVVMTSGDRTLGAVITVINLLLFGFANANAIFSVVPQINSSRTTATQMLHLATLPLHKTHETQGTKRLADPFPIKFNNLSFTYPSRPHIKTLDSISLAITPGSCTAIVGPSGSGKSTIAAILLGLYPPDGSSPGDPYPTPPITFAGTPISECNMQNIRSHLSIIPQTPILFPATIFSNITYGLSETSPYNNPLAVEGAARDVGIHDFITSLENGYNTLIGEGGQGLSGGQAQRIALARAIVRQPKVLVLDEATSALDAKSAEGIRQMVNRLRGKGGMAVLVISHGVEMMRIADTILCVEQGRIVERGSFEELKARGGFFARLIGAPVKPSVRLEMDTGVGVGGGGSSVALGLGLEERYMTPVRSRKREDWSRREEDNTL